MISEEESNDRREYCRIKFQQLPPAAISETGENVAMRVHVLDVSLGGARVKIDRAN